MNKQFANWTRRTAFNLTLTQTAISNLLHMLDWEEQLRSPNGSRDGLVPAKVCDVEQYGVQLWTPSEAAYLQRRGLIKHAERVKNSTNNYTLTEAGTLTARLLVVAGFQNHYHGDNDIGQGDECVKTMEVPQNP